MSASAGFLAGVSRQIAQFASKAGANPESIFLRFTLADGSVVIVQGLQTSEALEGWGMIHGVGGNSNNALIIRESHIIKVELELNVAERKPIGLHTEAGGER